MSSVGTVLARRAALGSCPGMDPVGGSPSSDLKAKTLGRCGEQVAAPYQTLEEVMGMALTGPEQPSPARLPRDPDCLRAYRSAITESGTSRKACLPGGTLDLE